MANSSWLMAGIPRAQISFGFNEGPHNIQMPDLTPITEEQVQALFGIRQALRGGSSPDDRHQGTKRGHTKRRRPDPFSPVPSISMTCAKSSMPSDPVGIMITG